MRRLASITILTCLAAFMIPGAADATTGPPPNPGPNGLYIGIQPDITPVVTPHDDPVVWGAAPPIDDNYGGTIYAGSTIEQQDHRPALDGNGNEPLRIWEADPADGRTGRPAIIWVHGGGFAKGIDAMWGLVNEGSSGYTYAQRGYVSFGVEYRMDTTLVPGPQGQPTSLCQWVQDNTPATGTSDPTWQSRAVECARNIDAARQDVLGSVRWLRAHAAAYGIDPDKIAVAGFSAGGVTASNTAYESDQVGTWPYFTGDDLSAAESKPQAVIFASGCTPDAATDPTVIDPGDVPVAGIQSYGDPALRYDCVRDTISDARSVGLTAELTSYCDESGHAENLYQQHLAATDALWTNFLARELHLYPGMKPPTTQGFCDGPIADTQIGHYVTHSYQDLLGRAPTTGELTAGAKVVSTSGRAAFEQGLVFSSEWIEHMVGELYGDVLGRIPDQGGLDYWTSRVTNGMTLRDVAIFMYGSPEYYAAHGGTPSSYVTALYDAILDRSPEQSGLTYWSAQVGTRGTQWVAAMFYQSGESRRDRVTAQYQELLERGPDSEGLAYWADRLLTEDDLALSLDLVVSDEYYFGS